MDVINLGQKFQKFNDHWSPRIIAELNNQQVKLAKVKGEFVWHDHANEDELFLVVKGQLKIEFRDGIKVLNEGEMMVVPRKVEHKPIAEEECHILLFEPKVIAHTGKVKSELTKTEEVWV